jgi:hypothetical protein
VRRLVRPGAPRSRPEQEGKPLPRLRRVAVDEQVREERLGARGLEAAAACPRAGGRARRAGGWRAWTARAYRTMRNRHLRGRAALPAASTASDPGSAARAHCPHVAEPTPMCVAERESTAARSGPPPSQPDVLVPRRIRGGARSSATATCRRAGRGSARDGPARPRRRPPGCRGRPPTAMCAGRTGTCRSTRPLADTAPGSPPDSHCAMAARMLAASRADATGRPARARERPWPGDAVDRQPCGAGSGARRGGSAAVDAVGRMPSARWSAFTEVAGGAHHGRGAGARASAALLRPRRGRAT